MNQRASVFMMQEGKARRSAMRTIICVLGIATAAAMLPARAEAAPTYRWCAHYQDRGVITCAYDTFQQCLATAGGGAGGSCSENPVWPGPAAAPRQREKRNN